MLHYFQKYIFIRSTIERFISIIIIITLILIGREFALLFISTFLFAYLFHAFASETKNYIHTYTLQCDKKYKKTIQYFTNINVLLTIIYIAFIWIFIITIRDIVPSLTTDMIDLFEKFSEKIGIDLWIIGIKDTLGKWSNLNTQISSFINIISPSTDTNTIFREFLRIGGLFFQIIFAFILSYIWLIEYDKIQGYFSQIKTWPFSFFYRDVNIFIEKIQKSFGFIFIAQSKIAIINTALTVLGLLIIGILYTPLSNSGYPIYPYLLALGCITFISSFIPIVWVFIGWIPIIFAGIVTYSGWSIVITVISMLGIIHAIEGYFLNPRIVGRSINVPTPIIFLILFLGQKFMGTIGFFIWVPIYLLCLELFTEIGNWVKKIRGNEGE